MRTLTNSNIMISYPDALVLSGDLNLMQVEKYTTATFVEISFNIAGYNYKENLYFHTNIIETSLSEIFELLFNRTENTTFPTAVSLVMTLKLYNNTTLIDTQSITFEKIILGKRFVFDKLGVLKDYHYYEYCPDLGITTFFLRWDQPAQELWYVGVDNELYYIDLMEPSLGFYSIDISSLSPAPLYLVYGTFDDTFDYTFQNSIEFETCENCGDDTDGIGLRFRNRFGYWRYYAFRKNNQVRTSSGGVVLDFISNNLTEYSGLKTEQKKGCYQSINIFKESFNSDIMDDLSDLIHTENVHIYDTVNSVWVPVRVQTNTVVTKEKDNLFDMSLSINLI